uniref:Myopalladin n=1 Tax=Latimeria chalumnae TaxID=7897 RepID=H3BDD1_LATCH
SMQDDNLEESTSISQLLRESYLAETRIHQGHNETSKSEAPSHHFYYGKEELDESVNLARQAIAQSPREDKGDEQHTTEPDSTAKTHINQQQLPESNDSTASSTRQQHQNYRQENVIKGTKSARERSPDIKKQTRVSPYSPETEGKKEFLNKAADFIEELSSLFKAHSSKRIRPRACKSHRSKYQTKSGFIQAEDSGYPYISDNRERPQIPIPVEIETQAEDTLEEEKQPFLQTEMLEVDAETENTEGISEVPPTSFYFEEPRGEPPHFTQKLKSREVLEGSRVQLDCIVTGFPKPEVGWYCEGKELENSPDIQIIQSGDWHSLIIAEAFEEDTGRYSCFASNIYGTDSTSAEIYIEGASSSESETEAYKEDMAQIQKKNSVLLNVSSPPPTAADVHQEVHYVQPIPIQPISQLPNMQSQSPTSHLQGLDGRPLMAAPVFTKMIQDLRASEGQLVVLECRVKGVPSPKVEWYREGTLIEDSPDFRILQKKPRSMAEPEEICTLVIAEVFPEDSGTFTCTASNKYGTVSSVAFLTVKDSGDNTNLTPNAVSSITVEASHASLPQRPADITPAEPLVCLKPKLEGVLVNHNEPRSSSKVGLRVHFKLPEDDKGSETSSEKGGLMAARETKLGPSQEMMNGQPLGTLTLISPLKEPPPVLAKPKLDATQLQQLHNQVLLEQQQEALLLQQPQHPSLLTSPPSEPLSTMNSLNSSLVQQSTSSVFQQPKVSLPQTFNYARPKQFIAAQGLMPSPVRSFSPSSSPVPMLNPVLQTPPRPLSDENHLVSPFGQAQSPGVFPARVLQSPTSPPRLISSPPLLPPLSSFSGLLQSQPQAPSPTPTTPSSSIPSPIQNSAAFLSSVLPSLPTSPATNAMGLPKSAPTTPSQSILKKPLKSSRSVTEEDIRDNKDAVIQDLERKLHFKEDVLPNGQQEYKVSSFEQRLMSEIEFRLERTPVEESDDEIQHDEIPKGKCIAPIFDKKLKHFRVLEGSPATFTCKIVGIPVPKVYWFKDGTQISKKNDHYKMKREGDGTCSLHIEAATSDDDGNYTIMAANPQGRISCSGHLMMQTAPFRGRLTPTVQSHRMRSRMQESDEGDPIQERFYRPHFLQAPGDMVAHEGRLCRLDCKVSGLPTPDLMWLLNGKPVLPDSTHKMLVRENGVHSLLIDPLMQSDGGTYTCIATNKAGQNSFSLELTVVAKEIKKAPIFIEKLQNTGIPEGHPIRLECRVVGMPPPVIFWKKDNETIPSSKERTSMHQDATGYVCLQIQPTRKEDAGWYTVSAKNEAGIVSCTARLDIYAQWHQQIPQPLKKVRPTSSRYAALTGQGLDIMSAFPSVDNPMVHSPPPQDVVESEEL